MNQEWMLLVVMVGLLGAVGAAAVVYNLRFTARVTTQFRRLAGRFGLELTEAPRSMGGLYQRNPTLWGHYQGREMSIHPRGHGLDNTRQTDVAVTVVTRAPANLQLTFAKRSLLTKLGQVGRLEPCATGDAGFDDVFSLRAGNASAVRRLFGPEIRQKLQTAWTADSGFLTLKDRNLSYEELGLPRTDAEGDRIAQMAELCLELAADMDTLSAS